MPGKREQRVKLLVIGDQPITLLGLKRVLESSGAPIEPVGFVATPGDAVQLARTHPPDVALLDIDGDHGVTTIPELLVDCCSRLLVLSATRNLETQDAVILAGACGIVDKREPPEVLLKAIEKVDDGEYWIDRSATVRILKAVARKKALAPNPEQEKIATLTRKERLTIAEVARDAAATGREIAERLHISEHTLRNHLSSIYSKLELTGRMELYAYSQRHGLTAGGPA